MTDVTNGGDGAVYKGFDSRYQRRDARFGVERRDVTSLPVIDISPFLTEASESARAGVTEQIREACISVGFFYLHGHGFAQSELDELLARGRKFFALPSEQKWKVHWNNSPGKGYIPPGGINAGKEPDKSADRKERLYLAREFATNEAETAIHPSESQWPDENVLPGFRAVVTRHTRKSVALAQRLAAAFARSLGLSESHFAERLGRFGGTLVYNYYPPLDRATLEQRQWNFSPHTDYGAFTVLLQDQVGGLQVRNASGQWIDVVPVPGTLIVNVGDMLAMITNDLYTSNLHRVANYSGRERMSVSLFMSPPADAVLSCLEPCHGPGNPPRYEPIKAGDYSRALLEQYHRTGRPGISPRTAGRLQVG
jgi:isopenicillin N synthase-like dioxygenase